jgi:hypothetical protein
VLEANLKVDPKNDKIAGFINQIKEMEKLNLRINELQGLLATTSPVSIEQVFELLSLYHRGGREPQFVELAKHVINNAQIPTQAILEIFKIASIPQPRFPLMAECLVKYLEREKADPNAWLELGAVYVAMNQTSQAIYSLQQAVRYGGEPIKEKLRSDQRLQPLWNNEQFRRMATPSKTSNTEIPKFLLP